MDQFVVAVEILRHPELRGLPVVVGTVGDPGRRGVVSGCSYEARAFGVRSGMALRQARRRCPGAVFLASDPEAYRRASHQVMATLVGFPADVEVAGWDEAFLGATTDDPERLARDVQAAVRARSGLACSVGIGDTRERAKVASALAKPGGVLRLTAANWLDVVGPAPPRRLWGVGPRTQARLAALGITTVAALARADPDAMAAAFGAHAGPHLVALARGEGPAAVSPRRPPPRSHGHQQTFASDLGEPALVRSAVAGAADEVAADLRRSGAKARRVAVTVRFAPFDTHTRSAPVGAHSGGPDGVRPAALAALGRFRLDRPVRMVAVRADLAAPVTAPPS